MVPFTVQVCYFWPPGRYSAPMWAAQPGIGWVLPNQGSDRWPVGGSGHPEPLDSQGKKASCLFLSLFFFSSSSLLSFDISQAVPGGVFLEEAFCARLKQVLINTAG